MASVLTIRDAPVDRRGTALVTLCVASHVQYDRRPAVYAQYLKISSGDRSVVGLVEAIRVGLGEIHVDPLLRNALGLAEGSEVQTEPVIPAHAVEVFMRAHTGFVSNSEIEHLCQTYLMHQPLAAGDRKSIYASDGKCIDLTVDEVHPNNHCTFEATTRLRISGESKSVSETVVGFARISGLDREIAFLRERVINAFASREVYRGLGLALPHGLLLSGPSGTGKTILAQALAEELRMPCIFVRGPELASRMDGGTEIAIRKVFNEARGQMPAVLIFDEIDALLSNRSGGNQGGERRVVVALLAEMDKLGADESILIIATTQMSDALDVSMRRAGRFDIELALRLPDKAGRRDLLSLHMRRTPIAGDVDLSMIAARTPGYTAADVINLCREATSRAACRATTARNVTHADIAVYPQDFEVALGSICPSAFRGYAANTPITSWEEIGGLDHVKIQLKEVVKTFTEPDVFVRFGIRAPRGVLLHGSPGAGKTALARVMATQCEANFLAVSAGALLSKWFSESESNVHDLFCRAGQIAPCVLFFDEIDGLAGKRGGVGNESTDRVLNQFLVEMDGLEVKHGVLILAATNRKDLIDEALLRPGRFDYQIEIPLPDASGREAIFRVHLRDKPFVSDVDICALAAKTIGFSGAEIEEVCRRGALSALRNASLDADHVRLTQANLITAIGIVTSTRPVPRSIGFTVS